MPDAIFLVGYIKSLQIRVIIRVRDLHKSSIKALETKIMRI
jgi:hypothetical protein